jgi:hypothetical protein
MAQDLNRRIVSRTRAFFTMHRRAGTVTDAAFVTAPDQQRTTPQGRRAAQHPGHVSASSCISAIALRRSVHSKFDLAAINQTKSTI